MDATRLMYSSKLEVLRGYEGAPDLRFDFDIDPTEEALFPEKYFYAGLVFSRHTDGTSVKLGVTGNKVPFFLFNSSDRPMSALQGAPPSSAAASAGGFVGGGYRKCRFYSGLGHYEISTTQFVSNTYAVDDPLTAAGFASPGVYDVAAGRVAKTTYTGALPIVGIVSKPWSTAAPGKNVHGTNALQFSTCFIPNRKVSAGS